MERNFMLCVWWDGRCYSFRVLKMQWNTLRTFILPAAATSPYNFAPNHPPLISEKKRVTLLGTGLVYKTRHIHLNLHQLIIIFFRSIQNSLIKKPFSNWIQIQVFVRNFFLHQTLYNYTQKLSKTYLISENKPLEIIVNMYNVIKYNFILWTKTEIIYDATQ